MPLDQSTRNASRTPMTKKLCLNMIVKNEAPVIRRCLASVLPIIDSWVIIDTGSTDGTQDVIRDFFREKGVPGQLYEKPWKDFAHNRSEALALARPQAEYSFIIDADDMLDLPADYKLPELTADSYSVDIELGSIRYHRVQLVRNALPWHWRGVLHEFLACDGAGSSGHLPILMRCNNDGARRHDPQTYVKDAAILKSALLAETDPFLISRYSFYLAQSYRDCGEKEKALEMYLVRTRLGFWQEEVFVSLYEAAKLKEALGRPDQEVIDTYLKATEAFPARAEALHAASRFCRLKQLYEKGYQLAQRGLAVGDPGGGLFMENWIYDYGLLDEVAVNAYWSDHFEQCLEACQRLLSEGKLPENMHERVKMNAAFAEEKIKLLSELAPDPAATLDEQNAAATAQAVSQQVQIYAKRYRIFRTIHVVWIGDEAKRPDNCIQSWRDMNPDWEVRVWGNQELRSGRWQNAEQMRRMISRELCGVADMMRWEILERHGGFAIDADAICLRPLPDWLFEPEVFACWENEIERPGLIANGYVYSHPANALIGQVIEDIKALPDITSKRAWQTTGPTRLTDTIRKMSYADITVYPSHYFIPEHLTGRRYSGNGPVFAKQMWGHTRPGAYDNLFEKPVSELLS